MEAMAGAIDMNMLSQASRAAASRGAETSRMTARPSTRPLHPPSACTTRAAISVSAPGASPAMVLPRAYSTSPAISTGRRPKRSEIGP